MKKSCFIFITMLSLFQIFGSQLKAQNASVVVSGCKVVVATSTNVVVPGNMVISSNTDEILNNGKINLSGNFTNNGNGFNTSGTGTLTFTGTTQQTVSGTGAITFYNATVNNTATSTNKGVLLSKDIAINGALTLTNGPLIFTGKSLTLNGGVSHTTGSLTASSTSNIVANGAASKALYFTNPGNVLHNFTINTGASNVTLDNALDITSGNAYGTVICDGSLNTNGNLTLKSDEQGTAAVGQSAGTITGNATVERFTNGNLQQGQSRRAWRLITSPVKNGQTIREAWQENGSSNTAFGTLITGENMPSASAASAQGYDFTGAYFHTSIKHYLPASNSWLPLSSDGSTTGTTVAVRNEQAYMLFVRGDRTVGASGSSIATLRAAGTLLQGTQTGVNLSGGIYTLLGNPYASTIDFGSIHQNNSATIKDQFYLWNSKLGSYGAYALVSRNAANTAYIVTPSSLAGTQNDDAYRYIPSGSGFFVSPATGVTSGSVVIQESDKAAGSVPPVSPFRVVTAPANVRQLVVNLNLRDSTITLADGFRALFSSDYESNEEDNSSGKIYNFNENLNLVNNGKAHIIEARGEVKKTDTLFMKMWFVTKRGYQLQMKGDNFAGAPGINAWLEDNYAKTKQPVSLSSSITTVDFDVNDDSLSSKSDRFRIVFENNTSVLPVTITKITAQPKNGGAEVNWTVANETNIKGYTVEKSDDGNAFTVVGIQQPAHNNPQAAVTLYSGFDAQPKMGNNLYRIRIEGKDGSITYSEVVKVTIGANGSGIQIALYPNPVREGKVNLQLTNLKASTYLVSVYTGSGQTVYQKKVYITLSGTTQTESLILSNNLSQGSYQIKVTDNKGNVLFTDKLIVTR